MGKCLLSVDWDYFIYTEKGAWGSYIENKRSLIDLWYKRYIQGKVSGMDIRESFKLSPELDSFWERVRKYLIFEKDIRAYVSDSHAWSYDIARENNCSRVCLFDSHSDLGYGGLSALNFEVNCSNWLGKLLKDGYIKEAFIFYSPFASEKPEHFRQMNDAFNIRYCSMDDLTESIRVAAVHICRSGAWTPPWLDERFNKFVDALGIPYEIKDCPERKWDPEHISFADEINYLMA